MLFPLEFKERATEKTEGLEPCERCGEKFELDIRNGFPVLASFSFKGSIDEALNSSVGFFVMCGCSGKRVLRISPLG